jgi:hypothetical protein
MVPQYTPGTNLFVTRLPNASKISEAGYGITRRDVGRKDRRGPVELAKAGKFAALSSMTCS